MQSSNFEQILESSISETRFTSVSTELSRWGIFGTEGTLSWAVLEKTNNFVQVNPGRQS